MKDLTDQYVRQALKNWAAEQNPPANGRARLLLLAAAMQREQTHLTDLTVKPKDFASALQSPLDQAMRIYNLPWLYIAHVALTPNQRMT